MAEPITPRPLRPRAIYHMSDRGHSNTPAWMPGHVGSPYRSGDRTDQELLSGTSWAGLIQQMDEAGARVSQMAASLPMLDASAGYRHLLVLLALGIDEALRSQDPYDPHISAGSVDAVLKWGMDCPDAAYLGTAIRGDATYRVYGDRGTVRYLGFQVMGGMQSSANVVADDLDIANDGSFNLWLSRDQRPGNWLALDPGASSLIVRQFFYDWEAEEPANLQIECVDRPAPALSAFLGTPPPPAGLARQLGALGEFVNASLEFWATMQNELEAHASNAFRPPAARTDIGGAAENVTVWGAWRIEPHQALVIEVTPPHAHYWSVAIGNRWWESIDYARHQSSLNGHQAKLDDDGVFRAVISHDDPGLANWLDPAGYHNGPMIFRWLRADEAPVPKTTVVPAASLSDLLPPSTPRQGPQERCEILASRLAGVRKRFGR